MTDYVESGVKLIADTDDYTSKVEDAISLAEGIDDLAPTLTIETEIGDSAAVDELTALDGSQISTEIDTTEGGEKVGGKSLLTTLHELGVNPLEIVMNIAGTILDVLSAINTFSVQPMLDLDDAVAHFNAQTNSAIPNARELFRNILYDDLGDSVDQIAQVATKAAQIGAPIEEATRAALTFTHTFKDEDPSAVLDTLNQLVLNGLAPNFEAAADIITVGFQNGANRSGDLLAAVKDNATAFKDLGFTGPQAMSAITTGLDAGFNSATQVAQALEKMKINVTAAAGNNEADASKTLDFLGIANPAETGAGWSAEFVQSVVDAIKNAPVSDAEKIAMVESLVGTKLGGKEATSLLGLDVLDSPNLFANVKNRAAEAAATSDSSLRGMIDDFMKVAQEAADNFLSSDAIDLPGKIEAIKTGLTDALNVLAEGGDLGTAITVGLKPLGLDDEFIKLESILSNFIITLLQVVASIQDLTGHGDQAASTRESIADMVATRLRLDLQTVNAGQERVDALTAAVRDGIRPDDIWPTVAASITDSIAAGNLDQAQMNVDLLPDAMQATSQILVDAAVQAASDAAKAATEESLKTISGGKGAAAKDTPLAPFSSTSTPGLISPETLALQSTEAERTTARIDSMATGVTDLGTTTDTATTSLGETTTAIGEQTDATHNHATAVADSRVATEQLTLSTETASGVMEGLNQSTEDTVQSTHTAAGELIGLSIAADMVAKSVGNAIQSITASAATASSVAKGDTGKAPPPKVDFNAGGGSFRGLSMVGEDGPELIGSGRELSVLNNRTSRALMQALSGMPFMQMGGAGASRVQNLTVVNNVQSNAQAANISYDIGQQVRGFN